jgi:integrase
LGGARCASLSSKKIEPPSVAPYSEQLGPDNAKATVRQHLGVLRMLFDYLINGGILDSNPAASVRGPRYVVRRGEAPVLSSEETRKLLGSIDTTTLMGQRDRALIGTMLYSFARVSAAVTMEVGDYFQHRTESGSGCLVPRVRSSIQVTLDRGSLVALRPSTGCFPAVRRLKRATARSNERVSLPQVEFSFPAAWQSRAGCLAGPASQPGLGYPETVLGRVLVRLAQGGPFAFVTVAHPLARPIHRW